MLLKAIFIVLVSAAASSAQNAPPSNVAVLPAVAITDIQPAPTTHNTLNAPILVTSTFASLLQTNLVTLVSGSLSSVSGILTTTSQVTSTESTALATSGNSAQSSSSPESSISVKIGTGIGIPIVILTLGTIAFVIYRNKKRRHSQPQETQLHYEVMDQEKSSGARETKSNDRGAGNGEDIHELQGADVHQLHGEEIAPYSRKLEGSQAVKWHELPASKGTRRGSM